MSTRRKHQMRKRKNWDVSYIKALKANFIAIVSLRPRWKGDAKRMMKRTFMATTTAYENHFFMQISSNKGEQRTEIASEHPFAYFRWLLKNLSISCYCCIATKSLLCRNTCSGLKINDLVISPSYPRLVHWCFIYLPPEVLLWTNIHPHPFESLKSDCIEGDDYPNDFLSK